MILYIRKHKKVALIFVLFIIALLFYFLNIQTPLFADDHSYAYSFYNGEKISNPYDIFMSMKAHYYSNNGRVILHFFSQLFMMIGKDYFNVINTISFLLLGFLIFLHGTNYKLTDNIPLLVFIYCSLFMFTPAFGQSFLWLDGASNYLYGIVIILIYLLPFRFLSRGGENRKEHLRIPLSLMFFST